MKRHDISQAGLQPTGLIKIMPKLYFYISLYLSNSKTENDIDIFHYYLSMLGFCSVFFLVTIPTCFTYTPDCTKYIYDPFLRSMVFPRYEGKSISYQPNLFQVEIHLFFFDVFAL